MIDTLSISQQLRDTGLTQEQAEAIAKQMGSIVKSELVTQETLRETELRLEKEIKEVELRLSEKMNVQLRWILGFIVGQVAITVTLLKFLG